MMFQPNEHMAGPSSKMKDIHESRLKTPTKSLWSRSISDLQLVSWEKKKPHSHFTESVYIFKKQQNKVKSEDDLFT